MTKKHFQALADEIACISDDTARRAAARAVANACKRFNPSFDRERFFAACGLNPYGWNEVAA